MGETEITWNLDTEPLLGDAEVARAVAAALAEGGRTGASLAVVFVDDAFLAGMHATYLEDPTPTDVMAFDLRDEDDEAGDGPDGELYVSVDRARIVAGRRGVPIERELTLYVVHGVLHLCGHDDHDEGERARMRAAESRVLGDLGFEEDERSHEFGTD